MQIQNYGAYSRDFIEKYLKNKDPGIIHTNSNNSDDLVL